MMAGINWGAALPMLLTPLFALLGGAYVVALIVKSLSGCRFGVAFGVSLALGFVLIVILGVNYLGRWHI